ncbi:uncharacterized protein THITE_164158, partial [Thermothielavioides terrestris NRRL 8126]
TNSGRWRNGSARPRLPPRGPRRSGRCARPPRRQPRRRRSGTRRRRRRAARVSERGSKSNTR